MTPKKGPDSLNPVTDLVDPLDYLILGGLPNEGELIAGAWPDGRSSKQLSRELFDGAITPGKIGPRLNMLSRFGFTVKRKGMGQAGLVHQRTPAGEKFYKEWLSKQPAAAAEGSDSE